MRTNGYRSVWVVAAALLLASCASLQTRDPLQVTMAGVESLPGEGMEVRLMVKLRVQNPNDAAIDFNGVALTMDVQGKTFASGVSDAAGSVPRFGETVVAVPVTISTFRLIRQAIDMVHGDGTGKLNYAMKGKLNGTGFSAHRFTTKGDLDLSSLGGTASESS